MNKFGLKSLVFSCSFVLGLCLFSNKIIASTYTGECGAEGDNLTYVIESEGGIEITLSISGDGDMVDYSDTNRAPWDPQMGILQSVEFSGNITSIGDYAFSNCFDLECIEIPYGVTTIGDYAFCECTSLSTIVIPETVTSIGEGAFKKCSNLTSVTILGSVTLIEDYAFMDCTSLTSITLPDGLESIGFDSFLNCSSLTSIDIPNSVTSIGDEAFAFCTILDNVNIPENMETIPFCAFWCCDSLSSINIPEGVTSISNAAFADCRGLNSIIIPYSVTSIEESAFAHCSNLNSVVLNKEAYFESAFPELSSVAFHFYYDVSYADNGHGTVEGKIRTYGTDNLELIITPDENYEIGKLIWSNGNETVELIPDYNGLYSMPDSDDAITISATFVLEDGLVESGECGDDLTWNLYRDGTLYIFGEGNMYDYSDSPWASKRIESLIIERGVTSISDYAFRSCSNLTNVSIPDSVTYIGEYAFDGCTNLTSISIPDSVTSIGESAFSWCINLISIDISNGITSISNNTFYECTKIECVSIPDSVVSIGNRAFSACISLEIIDIPNSVTTIGEAAFENCYKINNVVIPNSVLLIGDAAFSYCTGLSYVEIPDSVISIGDSAFSNCHNLQTIVLPDSDVQLGYYTFYRCPLISVILNRDSYNQESFPDIPYENLHYYYNVSYSNDSHGTISGKTRSYGTDVVSLSIVPDENYTLYKVFAINEDATTTIKPGTDGNYILPDSEAEVTIHVTFIRTDVFYTVTIGKIENGFVSVSKDKANIGDIIDVSAVPDKGYELYSISVNGIEITDDSFEMPEENVIVNVKFTRITSSGFCGSGLTWSIDDEGTLTFSGSGSMESYYCEEAVPWYDYRESIRSVVFDGSITSIGDYAFSGCSNLADITIPSDVWNIGCYAFSESGLTSIIIPDNVNIISYATFYNCSNLSTVIFPENLTTISSYAFYGCTNLASVTIPDTVNSCIGDSAFAGCTSLDSVIVSRSVYSEEAFPGVPVSAIHFYYAVYYSNNKYAHGTINGKTKTYGTDVVEFNISPEENYKIESVILSAGSGNVIVLAPDDSGKYVIPDIDIPYANINICAVFRRCDYPYACGPNLIWSLDNEGVLTISGTGNMYDWNESQRYGIDVDPVPWKDYKNSIKTVIFSGEVTSIGEYAFYGCENLECVVLPDSLETIGYYAFSGCSSLTGINIPEGVTSIGTVAFLGCSSLEYVTFPNTLTSIGQQAFGDCSSLTSIVIPEGVTSLSETFVGCTNLTSVSLPNGLVGIWSYAFGDCTNLSSVIIPNTVTEIGYMAFVGCSSLQNVSIPESVTLIGPMAFQNCTSLTSIVIPGSVNTIEYDAFKGCTSLTSVIFTDVADNSISYPSHTVYISHHNEILPNNAFDECANLNSVVLNKGAYSEDAFPGLSPEIYHFYYDVSYTDNGLGTVNGKARTYGTDEVELSITPDDNYEIDKVVWTNGTETIELIPDANGLYVMPDSETDAEIQVIFATVEEKDFTISPIEDETYTGFEIIPIVRVFFGTEQLVYGTDFTVSYSNNVNVGTATVTVTGIGEYTGTKSTTFHITAKSVSDILYSPIEYQTYTGSPLTPSLDVRDGDKTLISGTDYTVAYSNNINVGEGTATITGKGNYTGTASNVIVIIPKSVSGVAISPISSQTYTGSQITPAVTVKDGNRTLVAGTDYTVSYSNNVNVGTATITITGKGNYTGSKSTTFQISTKSVSGLTVSSVASQTYTGSQLTPAVTVKDGNKTLVSGKDYMVSYSNNVSAGTATITITGKGNYSGTKSTTFQISAKSVSGLTVSSVASQTYTGSQITPSVTVKDGNRTLISGKDYAVSYTNNVNAGTATITITGKGNYAGTKSNAFQISTKSVSGLTVSSVASQTYTGSQITPVVTVKDGNRTLVAGTDYTVSYSNNVNAGTATVTITGKGNYAGTRNVSFTIVEPELTYTWAYESDSWYLYDNFNRLTTGFARVNGVTYYMNESGVMVTGWQLINYDWYYFNNSGAMETGWLYSGGDWYYLAGDGKMLTGFQTIGGVKYYLSGSGAMVTGWQCPYGDWYYFNSSGAMETGWLYSGGDWYYLASDGKMLTGFQTIGGVKYYLSGSGAMVTGWQYLYGDWYYFNSSGAMETGWLYSGGDWYYLGGDGKMLTGFQSIGGETYYLSSSGAMVTGWNQIGGNWYYFYSSGAMARSGNVNSGSKSYNFDSNGVCTNPYSDTPVYSYEYVWIPQTGKKYHTSSSCSGMNNPTRVTLSDAKSLGYTACQKCCN